MGMGCSGRWMFVLLSIAAAVLVTPSEARVFWVGGRDGWVQHPSEGYNHWAERNRFQVNDTLYFRYDRGNDSVMVVSGDDYNSCSTVNPIQSLTNGNSTFKFDRSGPFFFISGIPDHCNAGQRLIVVVLAVRPKNPPTPPPTALPPTPAPTPGSPSPALVPSAPETPPPAASSPTSGSAGLPGGVAGAMVMILGYVTLLA